MDLLGKIQDRSAVVSVVGLGYAGLPLAVAFAEAGFRVLGVDVDGERVARLNRGDPVVQDVSPQRLGALVQDGRFRATTDYGALAGADSTTICVPTPARSRPPAGPLVHRAGGGLAGPAAAPGAAGGAGEHHLPRDDRGAGAAPPGGRGLRVGEDFYLGFAPERIDLGATSSPGHTLSTVPRLVAGATDRCRERVAALYETIVERVVPVSSLKTAEMAKLVENAFRMVNIGFANEVALMCDRLGTDVWEVIDARRPSPTDFCPTTPAPALVATASRSIPTTWCGSCARWTSRLALSSWRGRSTGRCRPSWWGGSATPGAPGQTLRGARVLVLG